MYILIIGHLTGNPINPISETFHHVKVAGVVVSVIDVISSCQGTLLERTIRRGKAGKRTTGEATYYRKILSILLLKYHR